MAASRIQRLSHQHLGELVALEQAAFQPVDQQSARTLRYLLTRAHADVWGLLDGNGLLAVAIVLYRRGSNIARVYSIATDRNTRQKGLGGRMLEHAERAARRKGCRRMRSEVRVRNSPSRRLFEQAGYHEIGRLAGYYPDGEDGLHLEKSLSGAKHG